MIKIKGCGVRESVKRVESEIPEFYQLDVAQFKELRKMSDDLVDLVNLAYCYGFHQGVFAERKGDCK